MTKTVIVAFNSKTIFAGTQTFAMQPRFSVEVGGEKVDVLVHFDPREGNECGSKVTCNYDVVIDNYLTVQKESRRSIDPRSGKPVIPLVRYTKSENMYNAVKAGEKYGIEVLCPVAVVKKGTPQHRYPQLPPLPKGMNKVIFKPEHGANGDFQFMVSRDKYYTMVRGLLENAQWGSIINGNMTTFTKLFMHESWHESHYEKEILDLSPMAVFPFVEDVVAEYRVLRGGDFVRVAERALVDAEGTTRVKAARFNMAIGEKLNDYVSGEASLSAYISMRTLTDFMDSIGHYYGSLDVYVRKQGDKFVVGIFEYSTQHGVSFVNADDHIDMAKSYIRYVLEKTSKSWNK